MATAYKDLYPDPTPTDVLKSHLLSDSILEGPRRPRYVHSLGLPGDLRIETDEPELREDVRRVVEALHRASRLEAGWDTYNARPVATAVFRPALDLAIHAVQRCSSPTITAVSDGGITLVWDRATQELELEVSPNGEISAFMIDQHGEEIEPGEAIGLDDAKGLIDSFCRS